MMNVYDRYADAYIALGARRSEIDFSEDPAAATWFELAGDVTGSCVLDAGCGAGFAARVLARGGADVTAVDISPRLVSAARETPHNGLIDYCVADLSLA